MTDGCGSFMKTADFDFHLPKERIALRPPEKRDSSRLLVLHKDGTIEHRRFDNIVEYLNEGDMLLLNNTKVFPARIIAKKPSGGNIDILLVKEAGEDGAWEVMCKGKFEGMITVGNDINAEIWTEKVKSLELGVRSYATKKFLRFLDIEPARVNDIIWEFGSMPLPPYIKRLPDNEDRQRYQTVYAEHQGSIAAPTAGLHFTEELLGKIKDKGVSVETLTLHVGIGTFKPVKAEFLSGHRMALEYFEIKTVLRDKIRKARESGRRLLAVGTTTTRAIEAVVSGQWSAVSGQEKVSNRESGLNSLNYCQNGSVRGHTDIFIYPGYKFNAVDSLITNFHLPRSTPLMLTSALCGLEKLNKAYEEAISMGYRFFSYGDAMLIL